MQTFREFYNKKLIESPLPDDWDGDIFDERISFAKRINYAKERAAKVGAGSSRVAFVIPYQGRQTVLKIAKNVKGMAQNSAEVDMFNDYYLTGLEITIPMIDYDEKNSSPTWIHTEFAQKAKPSDFVKACGASLDVLIASALYGCGKTRINPGKIDEENELLTSLIDLIGNFDIPHADFNRIANWGIWQGSPVILDLGLSSEVLADHYTPKRKNNNW